MVFFQNMLRTSHFRSFRFYMNEFKIDLNFHLLTRSEFYPTYHIDRTLLQQTLYIYSCIYIIIYIIIYICYISSKLVAFTPLFWSRPRLQILQPQNSFRPIFVRSLRSQAPPWKGESPTPPGSALAFTVQMDQMKVQVSKLGGGWMVWPGVEFFNTRLGRKSSI